MLGIGKSNWPPAFVNKDLWEPGKVPTDSGKVVAAFTLEGLR